MVWLVAGAVSAIVGLIGGVMVCLWILNDATKEVLKGRR